MAEIQQLDRAVGGHLDIGRFQIAVNDAALMRVLQRLGDLPRILGLPSRWTGVIEGSQHLRLTLKTNHAARIASERFGQKLQRHVTLQLDALMMYLLTGFR